MIAKKKMKKHIEIENMLVNKNSIRNHHCGDYFFAVVPSSHLCPLKAAQVSALTMVSA